MIDVSKKIIVGWNEWCSLPGLNIPAIKAKIDTGAKTSSIHAFNIEKYYKKGRLYVKFLIHPLQGNLELVRLCRSLVIDQRTVMSSNGHKEQRYVISTPLKMGKKQWDMELTLSNRDPLRFRMLLGREALANNVIIEPWRSLCLGKMGKIKLQKMYSS